MKVVRECPGAFQFAAAAAVMDPSLQLRFSHTSKDLVR